MSIMPGNLDYIELSRLKTTKGYKILEGEWFAQAQEIEKKLDTTASRINENSMRYHIGMLKGFKLAVTALERALARMEDAGMGTPADAITNKLFQEIKNK